MSRYGNGSAGFDTINVLAAGAVPAGGPFTLMVLFRPEQAGFGGIIQARDSGGNAVRSLVYDSSGADIKYFTDGDFTGSMACPVGDWQILSLTKPAGTATCRYHLRTDASGSWTHANGGSIGDASGPVDHIWIGKALGGRIDGEVAAIMWLDDDLTDGEHESADLRTGLASWAALNPVGLWRGNQASSSDPFEDLTGNGADETGVVGSSLSVDADDPPDWSYALSTTHQAAAALTAVSALTATAVRVRPAAAVLTAATALAATALPVRVAHADLTAATGLTAAGRRVAAASGTLGAQTQLGAAVRYVGRASVSLTAQSGLTATATGTGGPVARPTAARVARPTAAAVPRPER